MTITTPPKEPLPTPRDTLDRAPPVSENVVELPTVFFNGKPYVTLAAAEAALATPRENEVRAVIRRAGERDPNQQLTDYDNGWFAAVAYISAALTNTLTVVGDGQ
jgi:hypothetical protein